MRILRVAPFMLVAAFVCYMSATATFPSLFLFLAIPLSVLAAAAVSLSYAELPHSWGLPPQTESPRAKLLTKIIIGVSIAVTVTTCATQWPLHLAYRISKASLNTLAQSIRTGTPVKTPYTAGLFTVVETDIVGSKVFLYLDKDKGEPLVFIQGTTNDISSQVGDHGVIVLDKNWYFYNSL